ncbi:ATP-grasp domain-containing protein [Pseudobutyrivibrio sp. MD2005]|uniref:ATP-grasp domain-containing protein n=1 Tax=Pseudobutyrivibrio sp. MD2005 TaxID=1410616 RepID=UPI0004896142|nr:ATP-grasp domain-containing protein [Pseudobutyrivibrio sp. MD2005]
MRKIMIMGAGIYQVPLILKAKEMGLYVIAVSRPGDYPGFKYSDKNYYFDTRDTENILKVAKEEGISGICTTGTDVALKAVGYVNDAMNLHGVSYDAACICADKALMKDCFEKGGVKSAEHKRISSIDDAREWMKYLNSPVIIKPVDSSGSRGITRVDDISELDSAFEKAMSFTTKDYVVIERFIEGTEIGLDAFVVNNKVQFIAPHEKLNYFNGSTCVPVGHRFPLNESSTVIKRIEDECNKVISAIGLNDCAINMDIMISDGQPYILEASGRCGATCIPELISIFYNFDFYEEMISCAMGDQVHFEEKEKTPCIGKVIIPYKDGHITDQKILTDNPDIKVSLDYEPGEIVHKFQVGPDRIGQIIAKGSEINEEKIVKITIE